MPKLQSVSGGQMLKVALRLGFEVRRQKGSHVILRKDGRLLVIPGHAALKKGTLLQILKVMEITKEQLGEML